MYNPFKIIKPVPGGYVILGYEVLSLSSSDEFSYCTGCMFFEEIECPFTKNGTLLCREHEGIFEGTRKNCE
jgi:hypothetical protein